MASDAGDGANPGADGGFSAAADSGTATTDAGTASTDAGSVPDGGGKATLVAANASELHYEGRFVQTDPAGPHFVLPGSAVRLRFTGTSASATLGEHSLESVGGAVAHNWYDVTVDGRSAAPLQAAEGTHSYSLAAGLAPGEHQLVLRKRTEAYVGEGQFAGFELDAGAKALAVTLPTRRIEFVGDSITAGYGVDGADGHCAFSTASENYSHTYAALTSQALGAEQVAVAISGIGVYRDYSGSRLDTMNDMYLRALPTLSADWWDFSRWVPDAVIINLGTNDFATGDPGRAAFTTAYQSLIAQVRAKSPSALIVIGLGPMLSSGALTQARSYLTGLVADLNAASDTRVKLLEFPNQDSSGSYGCDYHPSAATHQQMADQLATFLRAQLGW